jgi:hypothetical protein
VKKKKNVGRGLKGGVKYSEPKEQERKGGNTVRE